MCDADDRPVLLKDEIKIANEMIQAGLTYLLRFHSEQDDDEAVVSRIF